MTAGNLSLLRANKRLHATPAAAVPRHARVSLIRYVA